MQTESALLVVCLQVERHVGVERSRLDTAASDGIPAHLTVIYPFMPEEQMTPDDHHRLKRVAESQSDFVVRFSRTAWFGQDVLYLTPDDPEPLSLLTREVCNAFPHHPPYGGRYTELFPHLTIGHKRPLAELEAAERSVSQRLPLAEQVDHLELWAGPAVEGRTEHAPWRRVRDYRLNARLSQS